MPKEQPPAAGLHAFRREAQRPKQRRRRGATRDSVDVGARDSSSPRRRGDRRDLARRRRVAPPIGLSTTFDDGADHVYSRISAPTRERCEAVLAALEGGEGARAVLFASGNAATHAVLASLAARARENGRTPRVATDGIGYHGTRDAVAALGPAVEVVGGAAELGEGDVVWLESPRNPDLRVPDVAGACAGPADVVVDATFAPLAQRLLDEDAARADAPTVWK